MKQKNILFRFLKLAYSLHKQYFFVMLALALITTAQAFLSAYTISLLIGQMEQNQMENAIKTACFLVILEAVLLFFHKLVGCSLQIHSDALHQAVNQATSEKIMRLQFSYLEDASIMELQKNAEMGVNNMGAVYSICDGFFEIFSNLMTLFGLGVILFTFDPILILILVLGILLNILLVKMSMNMQIQFFHDLLPINFKYNYYLTTLINDKNAKDFRMYTSYELMYNKFNGFAKKLFHQFTKLEIKMSLYQSAISTLRYIQMSLIYAIVGIRTLVLQLSISSFSLSVSAAITFSDCITQLIEVSSTFMRGIEYVKPILELMDLPEASNTGSSLLDEIETITFDHVSFAYPNTIQLILDDLSFEIHKNEKISIVGLNGAGKTTIVKLITRLYAPTHGKILINGKDIADYEMNSYMAKISSVFQDYKMFAMSIKDNVSLTLPLEEVKKLCYETGVGEVIEALPEKWNSILYKSYDEKGVELSGGQTQKIAIARALAKEADLLILDEPTSALDPLAEAEIYENFNALAKGKTALYISHRMSSSIFCDKILVLDHGKMQHFDTHANLMKKKDSLYYHLFTTQAKNYAH